MAAAAADAPAPGRGEPASDSGELTTSPSRRSDRSEASQDVPIALQVVTAVQIEKFAATDLSSMNGYIPGLDVGGEQPTQPGYTLRGISVSDFGIGTDSPIGIYAGWRLHRQDRRRAAAVQRRAAHRGAQGPAGHPVRPQQRRRRDLSGVQCPTAGWGADAKARCGNYGEQYYEAMVQRAVGARTWRRA